MPSKNRTAAAAKLKCSFCGEPNSKVERLIAGPDVAICNRCISLCIEEIETSPQPDLLAREPKRTFRSPLEIFRFLSEWVVGQHSAKAALSLAVYNHIERRNDATLRVLPRSNLLFVGPTGVGKTLLIKRIAQELKIPFVIASATSFTEAGYVGEDVESLLSMLLSTANENQASAEHGIVFLDEIDKIARNSDSQLNVRDVSGTGVQQALLTMLEGTQITFSRNKDGYKQETTISTANVMFVCSGAFVGIERLIEKRAFKSAGLIMSEDLQSSPRPSQDHDRDLYKRVISRITTEDLIQFGFIPEFAGRLSRVVPLLPLEREDFLTILRSSKESPTGAYLEYLRLKGIDAEFTDRAIEAIADVAVAMNVGARALRSTVDKAMEATLFNIHERPSIARLTVDRNTILEGARPKISLASGRELRWKRDLTYVVHAEEDIQTVKELRTILKPLLKAGDVKLWSEVDIEPGQRRPEEIEFNKAEARAALFLVSASFLAADEASAESFEEWQRLSEEGMIRCFWLLLSPCLYRDHPVAAFEQLNPGEIPVSALSPHERQLLWLEVGARLKQALHEGNDELV